MYGGIDSQWKIDLVSTTNFDDLVQAGVHSINPGFSIKTISSAVSNSVGFALNEGFPNIIKYMEIIYLIN